MTSVCKGVIATWHVTSSSPALFPLSHRYFDLQKTLTNERNLEKDHGQNDLGLAKLWSTGRIQRSAKVFPTMSSTYYFATPLLLLSPDLAFGMLWAVSSAHKSWCKTKWGDGQFTMDDGRSSCPEHSYGQTGCKKKQYHGRMVRTAQNKEGFSLETTERVGGFLHLYGMPYTTDPTYITI